MKGQQKSFFFSQQKLQLDIHFYHQLSATCTHAYWQPQGPLRIRSHNIQGFKGPRVRGLQMPEIDRGPIGPGVLKQARKESCHDGSKWL